MGGIAQPNQGNLDLTLTSPIIQRMRERCENFLPGLKNACLDTEYPLAQGLRPFRAGNVRVERESRKHISKEGFEPSGSRIIHSYGHGGSGWTLAFGCAEEVAGVVDEVLRADVADPLAVGCVGEVADNVVVDSPTLGCAEEDVGIVEKILRDVAAELLAFGCGEGVAGVVEKVLRDSLATLRL